MKLSEILFPLVGLLAQNGINYAIGGFAVAAWGEVRATRDIDIVCRINDLDTLKSALKASGLDFEHRAGDVDDPNSHVIRIDAGNWENPYEIDILAGIRGAPAGLLQRTRTVRIENLDLKVAGPEDVIMLKLLGGSALDLKDASGVLSAQGRSIDRSLLERICPPSSKAPWLASSQKQADDFPAPPCRESGTGKSVIAQVTLLEDCAAFVEFLRGNFPGRVSVPQNVKRTGFRFLYATAPVKKYQRPDQKYDQQNPCDEPCPVHAQ